jgi:hypothetical protein
MKHRMASASARYRACQHLALAQQQRDAGDNQRYRLKNLWQSAAILGLKQ